MRFLISRALTPFNANLIRSVDRIRCAEKLVSCRIVELAQISKKFRSSKYLTSRASDAAGHEKLPLSRFDYKHIFVCVSFRRTQRWGIRARLL